MITLKNLSCGYGKKEVLTNINIAINKAQLTCIIGKNGVGKTTLFKTILGLLPPISGVISFEGNNILSLSCSELAQQISYVPQAHGSPFPFKVLDIILMGQYVHSSGIFGKPTKQNVDVAMKSIQILGIENLAYENFSKISGGEKQMVLIARAMAQQPKFIALDEPTANLDLGNQVRVMKVIQMLKDNGYGIIMNTHSPEHALQFADNLIMINEGSIIKVGLPNEILKSDTLSELYNTPVEIVDTKTSRGEMRKTVLTL